MLLNRENKENRQVVLTIQVEQSAWEKALEDAYEQSKSLFKKRTAPCPPVRKWRKSTARMCSIRTR